MCSRLVSFLTVAVLATVFQFIAPIAGVCGITGMAAPSVLLQRPVKYRKKKHDGVDLGIFIAEYAGESRCNIIGYATLEKLQALAKPNAAEMKLLDAMTFQKSQAKSTLADAFEFPVSVIVKRCVLPYF